MKNRGIWPNLMSLKTTQDTKINGKTPIWKVWRKWFAKRQHNDNCLSKSNAFFHNIHFVSLKNKTILKFNPVFLLHITEFMRKLQHNQMPPTPPECCSISSCHLQSPYSFCHHLIIMHQKQCQWNNYNFCTCCV